MQPLQLCTMLLWVLHNPHFSQTQPGSKKFPEFVALSFASHNQLMELIATRLVITTGLDGF